MACPHLKLQEVPLDEDMNSYHLLMKSFNTVNIIDFFFPHKESSENKNIVAAFENGWNELKWFSVEFCYK